MTKSSIRLVLTSVFAVLLLSPICAIAEDTAMANKKQDSRPNDRILDALLEMELDADPTNAVSRVEVSESPLAAETEPGILAVNTPSSWDGMCNLSLCCHDWQCQAPEVLPECAGTCDLNTFLCIPD